MHRSEDRSLQQHIAAVLLQAGAKLRSSCEAGANWRLHWFFLFGLFFGFSSLALNCSLRVRGWRLGAITDAVARGDDVRSRRRGRRIEGQFR
jgi:hypothetical protein